MYGQRFERLVSLENTLILIFIRPVMAALLAYTALSWSINYEKGGSSQKDSQKHLFYL